MKIIYCIAIVLISAIVIINGSGIFAIIPQAIGLKQWVYIFITMASYAGLIILHAQKKGGIGLYLFYFVYPFLTQSVNYLNISSTFFILTPALLFLLIHLLLTKETIIPVPLHLLLLFCFTTIICLFTAQNKYTAATFIILAIGSFLVSTFLAYIGVRRSVSPLLYIRGISLSLLAGSLCYLFIETIAFQLGPGDLIKIIMRRWGELPLGRYYTGGYIEPAGIGFVYSLFFWVMLAVVQTRVGSKTQRWINTLGLVSMGAILIIAGTRGAMINLGEILIVQWFLRRQLGLKSQFKIKPVYILAILAVLGVSIYLLIPRTILTTRSNPVNPNKEPTYLTIGNQTFQLVGTTGDYVNRTRLSWNDFLHKPLGSGPLNAPLLEETTEGGRGYYYSMISNLIVTGANFGWLSVLSWLFFTIYVTYRMYSLKNTARHSQIYALGITLLAILWTSLLPGSNYLGPNINWTNFNYYSALSTQTPGLPAEYPAVISGTLLGLLIGILVRLRVPHRVSVPLAPNQSPPPGTEPANNYAHPTSD